MGAINVAAHIGRMFTWLKNRAYMAQTVTIQQATETQDATGAVSQSWSDLSGHVALPCLCWSEGGGEKRLPDGTFLIAAFMVQMAAAYPTVTEKMRAVVTDAAAGTTTTLDILLVSLDDLDTHTTLTCQLLR